MSSRRLARLLLPLLTLVLLAVLLWRLDRPALLRLLQGADPAWLAAAVVAAMLANLCSALRWQQIIGLQGLALGRAEALRLYAQGITLNTVLPGSIIGGDLWRAYGLRRQGHPGFLACSWTVLFDRISGVWGLCLMSLLALLASQHPAMAQPAFRFVYGASLAGVVGLPWLPGLASMLALVTSRFKAGSLATAVQHLHRLKAGRRQLWQSFGWSVLVQLGSAGCLWCCQQALGVALDPISTLALAAGLFMAAVVPLSVSGFGSREAAAVMLYPWLGISAEQGLMVSVLYGLCALLQGVLAAVLVPPSLQTRKALLEGKDA